MVYIWQPVFALSRSRQWFGPWDKCRGAILPRRATGHQMQGRRWSFWRADGHMQVVFISGLAVQ